MLIAVIVSPVGASIFQTGALRREMNAKCETVNQRFDNAEKRFDEERMERITKSLDELNKELRPRK